MIRSHSLLSSAIVEEDLDFISDLVVSKVDINKQDDDGISPLMYALKLNKAINVIKRLIDLGAKVNERDNQGVTPLMHALSCNASLEVIKLLIESGADVNAFDNFGVPCLMHAPFDKCNKSNCQNKEVLILLLKNGIDILSARLGGDCFLHTTNCLCILEFNIFNDYNIPIDTVNFEGHTSLMAAVIQNNKDKVEKLLLMGADANCFDKNMSTPLHVARDCSIIYNLIFYGASLNALNDNNEKPLDSLLKLNDQSLVLALIKCAILYSDNSIKYNEKLVRHTWKDFSNFAIIIYNYESEIANMKGFCIEDDLTVFEFCVLNKLEDKKFLTCPEFVNGDTFETIKTLFPNFSDFITSKLRYCELQKTKIIKTCQYG